ncbi:hypothetical protein DJ82_01195 [Halorubrum sp. Ib24]|uniref:hypothetical protein n=1 Tax=unclassified Halorubrum TaxID=2642239 RepID=UPI000B98558E|nr:MULTISPECIES: hypothetical protein [unclassified Halorubrum]OYR41153.1 hypothetical protein DJ81_12940 [Halorubrum sp. Hd13]OYR43006.1 hypothetical protein DJ82_01195 [Halorubrum sp. Ib24]OYR47147.1 hypothetical protein DJ74_13410 [Halorubrum sp. Ea8]OYR54353.1 hypothetical protein DJ73_05290 [Halorubrum sp. Ea1]
MSEEEKGIREGIEESEGDPRLILLLNAVLSGGFAWTVLWGLDRAGMATLTAANVGLLALVIFAATYLVVMR